MSRLAFRSRRGPEFAEVATASRRMPYEWPPLGQSQTVHRTARRFNLRAVLHWPEAATGSWLQPPL